jgi:hypothetical protein
MCVCAISPGEMKLRNRKLVEEDDGATPSQQNSVDKIHPNLDEDITIVSICEDNGDIEIIGSKENENSGQKKKTDDDLILVEEISRSSQAESNPRKRKRTDDEDVKVLNSFLN